MKPDEIEALSFKIIDREAGPHGFSDEQWPVVRRMIHTSADFEYRDSVRFHPDAVAAGIAAIRAGKSIITDTNMARVGIRQRDLKPFGATLTCYMNASVVHENAKSTGTTRAHAAVDAAISDMADGIYVIGNAPTALLHLIERIKEKKAQPALVIGLPVGFVNAAESKAELLKQDNPPYITNVGRKGGSNVAAAVVNALAIRATQKF
ncbi:MAG: precorrin-8X methylmutase [Desulfobacterales bacterium]|nr:precorrin-8X methylmutase [Desulfobacterales bacterium]